MHRNPLPLDYELTASCVNAYLKDGQTFRTPLDDFYLEERDPEENATVFVSRLDETLQKLYPKLVYRKYSHRPKTTEEMTISLMKGDDTTTVWEEVQGARRIHKVTRVDLKRSLFTLEDQQSGELQQFEFTPAALFLLRLRKGEESPEDLGEVFFKRARKHKRLRKGVDKHESS